MSFTESISSGFRRYFDFRTRSSRSEYWWWTLFAILVSIAMSILDALLFGGATILDGLSSLALLIPGLAVTVRRLHDVDRSGWWILIAFTIVGIIFPLIYWQIKAGDKGTNKYGLALSGHPPKSVLKSSRETGVPQVRRHIALAVGHDWNWPPIFAVRAAR